MVLVLVHVCAFFQEMLFDLFHLNHLFAFPAACKHWAFFPVMDVQSFVIETWVGDSTEVATCSPFELLVLTIVLFIFFLLSLWSFRWSSFLRKIFPDICSDLWFLLWGCLLLLWLLGRYTFIDFWKLSHQYIKLSLFKSFIVSGYFVSAHCSIQLSHTIICWCSYIVWGVVDAFNGVFCCCNL